MIFVNFKIYRDSWGEGGVKLAQICERVAAETGVKIIPVVAAVEYGSIRAKFAEEMYLGHVDWELEGAKTGAISMDQALGAGVAGSLINHSEKKLKLGTIKKTIAAKPSGFKLLTICQTQHQILKWGHRLRTDYLAWEPTELIGNKEISAMDKYENNIRKLVETLKVPLIIGAGIHQAKDVTRAQKAGAGGVLVASDVVTAADPEKELLELAGAWKP